MFAGGEVHGPSSLQKELARLITLEQGKTLADAEGDVFRGLRKARGADDPSVCGGHGAVGFS